MQHRLVRLFLAPVAAVSLFFAAAMGTHPVKAQAVAEQTTVKPNPTGLMDSKPPQGDPLKLGKQIMGNPAKDRVRSLKSAPVVPSSTHSMRTLPDSPFYYYGVGKQDPAVPPSGVSAVMGIYKPYINPTYDFHTLAELAVQSADEKQIVEVGWTRDMATYGDNNVHLFVYHWVNGQETCYDGCGYVDYAANTTTYAGMSLESVLQTEKVFAIQRTATGWWIGYGPSGATQWIGSFPDTLWSSATPSVTNFKQVNLFQGFGEVAAGSVSSSCADMGTGPTPIAVTHTTGAKLASVTYTDQTSADVDLIMGSTASVYSVASLQTSAGPPAVYSKKSFYYGGAGWC